MRVVIQYKRGTVPHLDGIVAFLSNYGNPQYFMLKQRGGRDRMELLAADIGGTNSRFSLFSYREGTLALRGSIVVSSQVESFAALLDKLFTCWPVEWVELGRASMLAFAAAGPVRDGRIEMTNASFAVEEAQCRNFFPDARVRLMNDFEAQAWACLSPVFAEAECLMPGACAPERAGVAPAFESGRPVAVVGAGTGLGAAWLMPGGEDSFVLPSEAGHVPFPFDVSDAEEAGFAAFLTERLGAQPKAGQVLSGSGLAHLHAFFTGSLDDPARFTSALSFTESDTCRLFSRFYGRFCRMAALSLLPQAVVVTGGVAGRTPALVRHAEFSREFLRAAGSHGEFLRRVPVWLNRHAQSGLWGAACAAAALAAQGEAR